MFKFLKEYKNANPKTKYFALNWLIYGLALLITTVYCYARLDFVRSYKTPAAIEAHKKAEIEAKANATSAATKIADADEKNVKHP